MLQADDTAEQQSAPISSEAAAVPLAGKIVYYAFPLRRRTILANLSRALPEYPSKVMAQRFYGHICSSIGEMLRFSLVRQEDRFRSARVDNLEAIMAASRLGKGVLVLTGHLGNWEVASLASLANLPDY